jgi:hypothetical protein
MVSTLGMAVLLERYRKREITYRRANRPNPAIHDSNLFILNPQRTFWLWLKAALGYYIPPDINPLYAPF